MKCQKWIKTNHFPIKNDIISVQKKFQLNRSFLRPPEFPLKFGSDPLKGEKKIVQIMGFMVFKSTGLDSRLQRKNQFQKICTECQDITKKVSKIGLPNQTSKIWHVLADISRLGAYFSKQIFALKPWVQAGRFEYHEPYNPNDFFFTYKGVRAILDLIVLWLCDS